MTGHVVVVGGAARSRAPLLRAAGQAGLRVSSPSLRGPVVVRLMRYAAIVWLLRATGGGVIDGGWADLVAAPRRHGLSDRGWRWANRLVVAAPRADVAVVIAAGPPTGGAEFASEEWEPWAWDRLAPWAGSRVVRHRPECDVAVLVEREPPTGADRALRRWGNVWPAAERRRLRVTPGRGAGAALRMYRSPYRRARAATRAAALLARFGWTTPTSPPLVDLEALAELSAGTARSLATMESADGERLIVGVSDGARLTSVLKVSISMHEPLYTEERFLAAVDGGGVFAVPALRWAGDWGSRRAIVMDAADVVADTVTLAEGQLLRVVRRLHACDVTHGDLTPWNLLRTRSGLVLLDWERAVDGFVPFVDLATFVVAAGGVRRRHPRLVARRLVRLAQEVAPACGISRIDVLALLRATVAGLADDTRHRRAVLAALEGMQEQGDAAAWRR